MVGGDEKRYRHVRLQVDGPIATLALDVDEDGGLRPGYRLKLNRYDLGVDIELHDALNRIRFEHPQVRTVVVTSLKERVFCSGANLFMLGLPSHAWKVHFCRFTNETRNGMEDSSRHEGLKFLATLTVRAPVGPQPADLAGIEAAAELAPLLQAPDAYFYVCGLRAMEEGVLLALRDIATGAGLDWETLAASMREHGRLHLETY